MTDHSDLARIYATAVHTEVTPEEVRLASLTVVYTMRNRQFSDDDTYDTLGMLGLLKEDTCD